MSLVTTAPSLFHPWSEEPSTRPNRRKIRARIGGLHCSLCTGTIEKALGRLPGVDKVAVSLTHEQALEWWRRQLGTPAGGAIVLVARDAGGIAGCVQLHPAWAPNQPHRADVSKLIVHRRARRQGIGGALMDAVEREAAASGFRLLVLDSRRGDAGERLYRRLGWTAVGVIPRYALDPDGATPHDTVVFYKELPG